MSAIDRIRKELMVEQRLLDGARSMLASLTEQSARDQCEASIRETQGRIDFLQQKLRSLEMGSNGAINTAPAPVGHPSANGIGGTGNRGSPPSGTPHIPSRAQSMEAMSTTNFDLLKYASSITSEKVKFRLKEVRQKLDTESKLKVGTDNLVLALSRSPPTAETQKKLADLRQQLNDAQFRITALTKAEHRYASLFIATGEEDDTLMDVRVKVSGRLKIRLFGATNLLGRPGKESEVYAVIKVDGSTREKTKPKTTRWDETFELNMDKNVECELSVYSKTSNVMLGLTWFKLSDLVEDLKIKYGNRVPLSPNEAEDVWLDMEPAGQLWVKVTFASGTGKPVEPVGLFRREAVQKAYPRNGHKFFAYSAFPQMSSCAVCNQLTSGSETYRCQSCLYTIHAKCYTDVITKCITLSEIKAQTPGVDLNTGQLLKFKIPHRFEVKLNFAPNWCMHCGSLITPGQRIHRCSECKQCAHRECSPMVPFFCGLTPADAKTLVEAFKRHEEDMHRRELEEAERARRELEENPPAPQFPNFSGYQPVQMSHQLVSSPATTMLSGAPSVSSQYPAPGQTETQHHQPHHAASLPAISTQSDLQYPPWAAPPPADTHAMMASPVAASTLSSVRPHRNETNQSSFFPSPQTQSSPVSPAPLPQHQQPSGGYVTSPTPASPPSGGMSPDALAAMEQARLAEEIRQLQINAARKEEERKMKEQIIKQQREREMELAAQRRAKEKEEQERLEKERERLALQHQQAQMAAVQAQKAAQQQGRPSTSSRPLNLPASVHKNVSLHDFNFIAVLGRGAFGKVMLAEEKATGKHYAIKALKKEFIIKNDDVKSAKLERRIFQAASAAQHPFMVNLHSCFQTPERVYFVMEYVSGGDLMCHIQEKKRFSQNRAKFYACEVLLAIEYFHKNNVIYRDLKLDNILMSPDGHLKVADYGICKENMPYGATTRTYCGTPDYMAPEILAEKKYGRAVDWWSFGVLIYVMLVGRYPFPGGDERDILDLIMSDAIEYPSNMPRDTLSLLQQLLNKDPARRLGGGKLDAEEVKRHPYFAGVDWNAFMQKRVPPPWKPTITSATDVSNFDAEFTREPAVLTPIQATLNKDQQKEFDGFDYVADWAGR
ncbi:Serine/threonine kinase [Phlyctochytrium bullatum]|nr:Serine/threonine kinase [Phlyctochytrium bullatum]